MVKSLSKETYQKAWKLFNGSCLQSWYWGEVKKVSWHIERLGVFQDKELIAIATVFIRKFPIVENLRFLKVNRFAYIPRGIAVKDIKQMRIVLKELECYFKPKALDFILIDPDNNILVSGWNHEFRKALEVEAWKVAGLTIQPGQTNIINIAKTEEELFSNIRPKWRRNIRKAKREGVCVQELKQDSAIEEFLKVLFAVKKRAKFKTYSEKYFKKVWEQRGNSNIARIFVASYKDQTVATYLILENCKAAYEIYGGATLTGRKVEASFLLKWEILKIMHAEGKLFYDQWGVSPKDAEKHPLFGISYFKSGFGGEYVEFLPQYVKVFKKTSYFCYKVWKKTKCLFG